MALRRFTALLIQVILIGQVITVGSLTSAADTNGGRNHIRPDELKEWLTQFASDEFEGRATFTEGLGLAAGYIAGHLKSWGVKPGGDRGSYFQRVTVLGVKSTNRSTVTVETGGQTRTFKNGEGISFSPNVGAKRALASDEIEFVGYGLNAPAAGHNDFADRSVKGKVVVFLGQTGPASISQQYGRLLRSRSRFAIEDYGALATIGPATSFGRGSSQATAPDPRGSRSAQTDRPDFTTAQRLDSAVAPTVGVQDEFFEFLLSGQDVKYAELKDKAAKREPLPPFTLKGIRIMFNIDADYQVMRTQYTRNVVGIVEGGDARLKETYVAFGAHYDHVGFAEGELVDGRRVGAVGRVTQGATEDRVWNGADDDGSGTVTLMGIAKAFAQGPKPRRSLIFVWHAGEERGLLGSRYFADYPSVPIDRIVAQINMDMVGRNRNDDPNESNTVYLVGSDRISTQLHNMTVDANASLPSPLKLDFSMNDPTELEQIYYRSDHYSYAAKGIPIVFVFTGLHADYHANTDSADKINYEKMSRIGQFVHEIGMRVGNSTEAPVRDRRGPRVGKTNSGKL